MVATRSDTKVRRMVRMESELEAEILRIAAYQHHPVSVVIRDLLRQATQAFWEGQGTSTKGGAK